MGPRPLKADPLGSRAGPLVSTSRAAALLVHPPRPSCLGIRAASPLEFWRRLAAMRGVRWGGSANRIQAWPARRRSRPSGSSRPLAPPLSPELEAQRGPARSKHPASRFRAPGRLAAQRFRLTWAITVRVFPSRAWPRFPAHPPAGQRLPTRVCSPTRPCNGPGNSALHSVSGMLEGSAKRVGVWGPGR